MRQELSALVLEVKEFALSLRSNAHTGNLEEVADSLDAIVRGDPR